MPSTFCFILYQILRAFPAVGGIFIAHKYMGGVSAGNGTNAKAAVENTLWHPNNTFFAL